jgi:hypothetical protein
MSLFSPPSPRTCGGSHRWSRDRHHSGSVQCVASELRKKRKGERIKTRLSTKGLTTALIRCGRPLQQNRPPNRHRQNTKTKVVCKWCDPWPYLGAKVRLKPPTVRRSLTELSLRRYLVAIRVAAGGGSAAGDTANVSHVFQPEGRSEAANSAYALRLI